MATALGGINPSTAAAFGTEPLPDAGDEAGTGGVEADAHPFADDRWDVITRACLGERVAIVGVLWPLLVGVLLPIDELLVCRPICPLTFRAIGKESDEPADTGWPTCRLRAESVGDPGLPERTDGV